MSPVVALPQVTLFAAGTALPAADVRALAAVHVQQRLALPALCELIFADPPGPLNAPDELAPGTALRVRVGEASPFLFEGEVTAVEHVYGPAGEREIRVRAYDLLHRLRKRQSVRVHVQTTVRELAEELVVGLGVGVAAAAAGPLRTRLIQHDRTDFQLLADLSAEIGLYPALRDGVLHLLTLAGADEAPLPLVLGESLLEARIEVNGEPASRSVRFSGWNPLRVEPHDGRTGAAAIGRQVAAAAPPERLGGDGQRNVVGQLLQDDAHARAAAQAELDRRVAYEVALWGVAEGDPRLRPGTPVTLTGVAGPVAGRYVLTAVTHTVDGQRGFISEISTLPPAPVVAAAGRETVALGTVTAVNDPQRLGRVRASLPGYSDVETDWMHVLCPAAGPNKGLVALPDVGDRVLVLLAQGEPAAGVVLGGLFGMAGPADSGVEGNSVRRYTFQTPGGQRIQLDDARRVIRLEDNSGNVVELTPELVRVHAAHDLELEAPGHTVVIRGQKIDFQRG